jgi:hypothetical protein
VAGLSNDVFYGRNALLFCLMRKHSALDHVSNRPNVRYLSAKVAVSFNLSILVGG